MRKRSRGSFPYLPIVCPSLTRRNSKARLASLYSDFSYQAKTNPEGYIANISAWRQALGRALRAGKVPSSGANSGSGRVAGNDTLVLETGEELSRALDTRTWGRPVALGSVIVSFNAPMSAIWDWVASKLG